MLEDEVNVFFNNTPKLVLPTIAWHKAENNKLGMTLTCFGSKKILENFDIELKKFKQVCPIEMLDKLDNPITLKPKIKRAS